MTGAGGFAPYDQAHTQLGGRRHAHAAHRVAQPRPGPRDHLRADRLEGARHPRSIGCACAPPSRSKLRRQPDRRLAHAARPGQRDALGLAGGGEERPEPRRRAPRERAAGHRVRPRRTTASREPTARCASTSWRRSIPGKLDLDFTDAPRCRPPFRTAATSPRWRSIRKPAMRHRVLRRLRRRRQHHQPPDRRRARCRAASRRARGTSSCEQGLRRHPASSSPAASWTTPCRAPGWSAG